jgi:type II secretory pathway predicted ATPase ExeA
MEQAYKIAIREEALEEVRYDEKVHERLLSFMARWKWRPKDVSRAMQQFFGGRPDEKGRRRNTGLGEATIRNYIEKKARVSQEAIAELERKLTLWLDYREHVGGKPTSQVREDYQSFKQIKYAISLAAKSRQFVVVVAPSGIGKTLVAMYYGNHYTNGDYVIVEPFAGITPRAFLVLLAEGLGLNPRGTQADLIRMIRGELRDRPQIIVVDEADFLHETSLNHLVTIWNGSPVGIVLLGTRALGDLLRSPRLERIRTRMRMEFFLGRPTRPEIERVLTEKFGRAVTEEAVKAAEHYVKSYRELDTLVELCEELLKKNKDRPLLDIIRKVGPREWRADGLEG